MALGIPEDSLYYHVKRNPGEFEPDVETKPEEKEMKNEVITEAEEAAGAEPESETVAEPLKNSVDFEVIDEIKAILSAVDWTQMHIIIETGSGGNIAIHEERNRR